jgi:uncharacterized membrane protein YfcA
MDFVLVAVVALCVSGLTLYSGFGLGTLLMPVFALFFPIEVAVAATAVVHFANNVLKVSLLGKNADRSLVLRFGIPAILAAFLGAYLLNYVAHFDEITRWQLGPRTAIVTPIKLVMGVLMFIFAMFELAPGLRDLKFDRKYLTVGGLLSGFFGGFSGHQGALRSAFLVRVGVSTEAFVGTNAVIGFMVDSARIVIYGIVFFMTTGSSPLGADQWPLIVTGMLAAFLGVFVGKRYVHKVTMKAVQTLTGVLLLLIAFGLGSGII